MKTIEEIEGMIRAKRIDEAVDELESLLAERPDDAEARMLFGVCQQMKGRTEAFCEIYRDLAPSMSVRDSSGEDSSVVSRWRHYCKVAAYLVAIGVISLVGTGCASKPSLDRVKTIETKSPESVMMTVHNMGGRPMEPKLPHPKAQTTYGMGSCDFE